MVTVVPQRPCAAGPCCVTAARPALAAAALARRRVAPQCSSSAAGTPAAWQQQPAQQRHTLVQRLSTAVQRAAAAVEAQRAAAGAALARLLHSRQQLGSLLLYAAAAAAPLPGGGVAGGAAASAGGSILQDLLSNYVFVVGFCGWFSAQFLKIFTKRYKTGVWDLGAFFDSGGMPSSHSSLCSSVTTAIAMQQGLGSPLFSVAVCFSVIVMYDAMGIRRHAGLQAQILNVVAEEVLEGHPLSERKLKEVLGHTPRQVYCGLVLGILIGLLMPVF